MDNVDKVILLDMKISHAKELFAIISKHKNGLRPWLDWIDRFQAEEEYTYQIEKLIHEEEIGIQKTWVIEYNGHIVGEISVDEFDARTKKCEMGYWISPDYQGKNIAFLACKKAMDFCFEKLNIDKIEIRFIHTNKKSKHLAERLGFNLDGILRKNILFQGKIYHEVVMSIFKEEL